MAIPKKYEKLRGDVISTSSARTIMVALAHLSAAASRPYQLGDSALTVDEQPGIVAVPDSFPLGVRSMYQLPNVVGQITTALYNQSGRELSRLAHGGDPVVGEVGIDVSTPVAEFTGSFRPLSYDNQAMTLDVSAACHVRDMYGDGFPIYSAAATIGLGSLYQVAAYSPGTEVIFTGYASIALGREIAFGLRQFDATNPTPIDLPPLSGDYGPIEQ